MLSGGRNLDQLKAENGRQAQASFQKVAARDDQIAQALANEKLTDWTFGPLPEIMEIKRKGQSFIGYPALVDKQTHCDLARKSVVEGKSVSVRVDLGGRRIIKKKVSTQHSYFTHPITIKN